MDSYRIILSYSAHLLLSMMFLGCQKPKVVIPTPDLSSSFEEVSQLILAKAARIEEHPDSAKAWGEYAMALDAHEYFRTAIQAYQIAHQLEPENAQWSYLLSMKVQNDDLDRAIELLESSLKFSKHQEIIRYRLGEMAREQGDLNSALRLFLKISSSSSLYDLSRYQAAQIFSQQSEYEQASKILDRLEENYKEVRELQGRLLLTAGKNESARETINSAIPMKSILHSLDDPYLRLIMKYRRDPFYQAMQAVRKVQEGDQWGLVSLRKLVERHPDLIQIRLQYANVLMDFHDYATVDSVLDEAIIQSPENAQIWALKASSQIEQQSWLQAKDYLIKSLELKPTSFAAHADLGYVFEQLGDREKAIEEYQQALKIKPAARQIAKRLEDLKSR